MSYSDPVLAMREFVSNYDPRFKVPDQSENWDAMTTSHPPSFRGGDFSTSTNSDGDVAVIGGDSGPDSGGNDTETPSGESYKNHKDRMCRQGPSRWCSSPEWFQTCIQSRGYTGTMESFAACNPTPEPPVPIPRIPKPPAKQCHQGPVFWCANDDNFKKCIQSKGYDGDRASFAGCQPFMPKPSPDPDSCTRPAFFCASDVNFEGCHLMGNRLSTPECKGYPGVGDGGGVVVGSNSCTDGPAFFCASDENFKLCNNSTGDSRQNTPACRGYLTGGDVCKQGPERWCASESDFRSCARTDKSYEEFCSPYNTHNPTPPDVVVPCVVSYCPTCGSPIHQHTFTQNNYNYGNIETIKATFQDSNDADDNDDDDKFVYVKGPDDMMYKKHRN